MMILTVLHKMKPFAMKPELCLLPWRCLTSVGYENPDVHDELM